MINEITRMLQWLNQIIDTQNMSAKLSSVSVDEDALNLSAARTPPAMPAPMILYIQYPRYKIIEKENIFYIIIITCLISCFIVLYFQTSCSNPIV